MKTGRDRAERGDGRVRGIAVPPVRLTALGAALVAGCAALAGGAVLSLTEALLF